MTDQTKEQESVEFIDQKIEKKEHKNISFRGILDGSLLAKKEVAKQLPFIIFLTLLGIIYIANRYHAERVSREVLSLQEEVKELRAESITTASELMFISKQSEVSKLVEQRGLGLKESLEPPKKIVIEKK
jgi:hypothetical protein